MSLFDDINKKGSFRGKEKQEVVTEKRTASLHGLLKNKLIAVVLILVTIVLVWFLAKPEPILKSVTQPEVKAIVQLEQAKFEQLKKQDLAALETVKTRLQNHMTTLLENAKSKQKADDQVRAAIAANPNLPVDYLERLSFTKARTGVAQNPATPADILARLSLDVDQAVRAAVASNPNTPPDILQSLAMEEETDILLALASNPHIPEQLLNHFIQEGDVGLLSECDFKKILFSHKKLGINRLKANRSHSFFCVRIGIAANPNATPELLSELAKDEERFVREAVAENRNTTPELLSRLVRDESQIVRAAVAKNPNSPTEILTYLVSHEEDGWLPTPRDYAFSNPNISIELLEKYVQLDDLNIRSNIADNTKLPESILSQLISLNNLVINEHIARNSAAPMTLLNQLAQDDSMFFNLRDDVASNPNYPVENLISLLEESSDQAAGVKGLLNEMSSFYGMSPEFIEKWKDDNVAEQEHQQLERYIFMVFWDNLFHPDRLDELYRQALSSLQSELENNRKRILAEIIENLANNTVVKMELVFDKKQLQQDFETALPTTFSEEIQLSENISGLVNEKAKSTSSNLTLQVLLKSLMANVIKETARQVLKDVALKMTAKRGASSLVKSIPGIKMEPRKKLLRVTLNIAIGVLGEAYDLYAQHGLDDSLMAELDKLKNNLVAVSDDSLQKVFENYHNHMSMAFNETLTKNVSVKHYY
jgi:hypothetical protein